MTFSGSLCGALTLCIESTASSEMGEHLIYVSNTLILLWYRCTMEEMSDGQARVQLEGNDQGLAAGQFACFYQGGICLGSAVILQGLS